MRQRKGKTLRDRIEEQRAGLSEGGGTLFVFFVMPSRVLLTRSQRGNVTGLSSASSSYRAALAWRPPCSSRRLAGSASCREAAGDGKPTVIGVRSRHAAEPIRGRSNFYVS